MNIWLKPKFEPILVKKLKLESEEVKTEDEIRKKESEEVKTEDEIRKKESEDSEEIKFEKD